MGRGDVQAIVFNILSFSKQKSAKVNLMKSCGTQVTSTITNSIYLNNNTGTCVSFTIILCLTLVVITSWRLDKFSDFENSMNFSFMMQGTKSNTKAKGKVKAAL